MRWLSLLKGIFGNPRQAFLKEAETLWPEFVASREKRFRSLRNAVEKDLDFLAETLENRNFVDHPALKAFCHTLLKKTYFLVNHAFFFGQAEPWLSQRLEEIEIRIKRILSGERGEAPLVSLISQLDLEDEDAFGLRGALLGEVRNVLGLSVPEGLVFSKIALEELLKKGLKRLPYKLQSEWRSALKGWAPQRPLCFYVSRQPTPKIKVPPQIESLEEALSACLPDLDPNQGLLVFEEFQGTIGRFWTTAPGQKGVLKFTLAEEEYILPKPPPFEGKALTPLSPQELSSFLFSCFKMEHYFSSSLTGAWILAKGKDVIFWDLSLEGPLPGDDPPPAVLWHGGVPVVAGVVSGIVGKGPSPQTILLCGQGERPVLESKIKGLIWEAGDPLGPEAAFLREQKIPALFQAQGTLEKLKPGEKVTLDTYKQNVYAGGGVAQIERLPFGGAGVRAAQGYRLLRRLRPLLLAQGPSSRSLKGILAVFKDNRPA